MQAASCDRLPNPIAGSVDHPDDPIVGDIAVYSCFFGLVLIGNSTRQCLASGMWSGDAPTCEGKISYQNPVFRHVAS